MKLKKNQSYHGDTIGLVASIIEDEEKNVGSAKAVNDPPEKDELLEKEDDIDEIGEEIEEDE